MIAEITKHKDLDYYIIKIKSNSGDLKDTVLVHNITYGFSEECKDGFYYNSYLNDALNIIHGESNSIVLKEHLCAIYNELLKYGDYKRPMYRLNIENEVPF